MLDPVVFMEVISLIIWEEFWEMHGFLFSLVMLTEEDWTEAGKNATVQVQGKEQRLFRKALG